MEFFMWYLVIGTLFTFITTKGMNIRDAMEVQLGSKVPDEDFKAILMMFYCITILAWPVLFLYIIVPRK